MRPLFSVGIVAFSLVCLFAGAERVSAAGTSNEFRSIVRLELPGQAGKSVPMGSGVIIDQDGRVLTSYSAVAKLVSAKATKAIACLAKDEVSVPVCNLEATLLKVNAGNNLALLQIKRILTQNEWRSVEEEKLRSNFSFSHVSFNKSTTTEAIRLGDDALVFDYSLTANASLTQNTGHVTGFERRLVKDKSTPFLVKTDISSAQKSFGGAVLNDTNELVGIPTMTTGTNNGYAAFTSLPVINAFLKEALTANYLNNKITFVFESAFNGVLAGPIGGTLCPESARYETANKSCTCNNGFFAVGNACILGVTYCQVMYPKQQSAYDIFLKACTCQQNGETRICPDSLKKVIKVTPPTKVATSTKVIAPTSTKQIATLPKATSTKAIVKPATSTQSVIELACKKKTGWSYVKKTNTCVPVGKLSKQADLASCNVVGMLTTKRYFLKGHSAIKRMTYRSKECFVDEAAAQKAKYKKSPLK